MTCNANGSRITTVESTTIKIWGTTRRRLKVLAALMDRSMVEVLDELVSAELGRRGTKDSLIDSETGKVAQRGRGDTAQQDGN